MYIVALPSEPIVESKANDFIVINRNLKLFDILLVLALRRHHDATVIIDTALKSVVASHEGWLQPVVFQILVDLMHRTAIVLALVSGARQTHC